MSRPLVSTILVLALMISPLAEGAATPNPASLNNVEAPKGQAPWNPQCVNSRASVTYCDDTYSRIAKHFESVKAKIKEAAGAEKIQPENCASQSDSQSCAKDLYSKASQKYQDLNAELDKDSTDLTERQTHHIEEAKQDSEKMSKASKKFADLTLVQASSDSTAEFSGLPTDAGRIQLLAKCENSFKQGTAPTDASTGRHFCEQIMAAQTSRFFAQKFLSLKAGNTEKITELNTSAEGAGKHVADIANDKGTGISSPMGLDDMLKMATVGIMGAGLYCSVTGKCSPKPSTDTASSLSANPNPGGATSPTPSSLSSPSGPGSSTLGNSPTGNPSGSGLGTTIGTSGVGSIPPAPAAATTPSVIATTAGPSSDSSTPRSSSIHDSRSPATAGAVGAGGGGAALPSSNGAPADSTGASVAGDAAKGNDYSINPGAGSGSPSVAGGFSLGDSHSSAAADAALKSILNGDSPPMADPLAGLNDAAAATPGQKASDGAGASDPENLFLRVRESYQRCMKRSCVSGGMGLGAGDKI